MIYCLSCGFPWTGAVCSLCGSDCDPRDHYSGYHPTSNDSYFITLIITLPHNAPTPPDFLTSANRYAMYNSETFFLFSLDNTGALVTLLKTIRETYPHRLLFNGKQYPLAQELWLPLVRFFE